MQWDDAVDVRGLYLDSIVRLNKGSVEVYLSDADKPAVGDGLNKPATVRGLMALLSSACYKPFTSTSHVRVVQVTLEKVFKLDRDTHKPTSDPDEIAKFTRKLQRIVAEQDAQFLSYNPSTGEWKFKVRTTMVTFLDSCWISDMFAP